MNDIEILEKLENMQKTFIEEGLQGYEMVIVNTKNLINKLIARNKELEEKNKELNNCLQIAKQIFKQDISDDFDYMKLEEFKEYLLKQVDEEFIED